ncbi:helix-turn-helix domain-containing protein [Nostoc sphaeroides]|uniref:Transposase putative helix-turn-helix domain-containing protein n=1 Tax=Nostoc sphaeroides CCNUC1 TaxID=2653204 RepID=A0A5P8W1H1_9NOSO|nr:hypothetical protein GXM_03348 [Nostoc sphaeroides CCNUC1]
MLTAIKVRLYPSSKQQVALSKSFGCADGSSKICSYFYFYREIK